MRGLCPLTLPRQGVTPCTPYIQNHTTKHTMPHTTQKPPPEATLLLEYSELELLRRTDANPALHELLAQAVPLPKTAGQPQHYALSLTEEQSDNLADCLTGILLHQGCDPQGEVNSLGFFVENMLDRLP